MQQNCSCFTSAVLAKTVPLQPFYGSLDFVWDNPGSQYQKKHSPTHTYCGHQSSLICFYGILPVQVTWVTVFFAQSLSFSLVNPSLPWGVATRPFPNYFGVSCFYSSGDNLFASHTHTIATCFAVVPRLCHLIRISLSTLYLELYLLA